MDFNMMREMQSKQERFEKVKYEARNDTQFPLIGVSFAWLCFATKALKYASPLASGLSPQDFEGLAAIDPTKREVITLFQMGALCNNLESCSAHQLDITIADYAQLLNETAKYAELWNKQDAELMKKVQMDFDTAEAAKRKAEPMKVIKAEA